MSAMAATHDAPPSNRALIVVGFICATLFTSFVAFGSTIVSGQIQADRAERAIHVNRFIEATQEYDPLARTAIREVSRGRVSAKTREELERNLQKQSSLLESATGLLPREDRSKAEAYQDALVRTDDELDTAEGPLGSRDFVQAAVNVREQRDGLIASLRGSAGISVKD